MSNYLDINVNQGTTFNASISLTDDYGCPINLAFINTSSQIKSSYYSSNIVGTFNIATANVQTGLLFLNLDYGVTANIRPGTYLYDVVTQDNSGSVQRILEGQLFLAPGITIL